MSFNMSKIYYIIDIIGQFLAPNRKAIEEPKEVLTFNLCQLLNFFQYGVRKLKMEKANLSLNLMRLKRRAREDSKCGNRSWFVKKADRR